MGLYNRKTTTTLPLICSDPDLVDGETSGLQQPVRVYLDRTRQLILTTQRAGFGTHVSQSVHSDRPRRIKIVMQ